LACGVHSENRNGWKEGRQVVNMGGNLITYRIVIIIMPYETRLKEKQHKTQ
jgi:hypothetical protein